jgi:ribosomal protein S12 methylthiotransferase accessory factor
MLTLLTSATRQLDEGEPDEGPFAPVHHLDIDDLTVRSHRLVPDPECPRCGRRKVDTAAGAAVSLTPAPKPTRGTFRLRSLEDFAALPRALTNPVCGVVGAGLQPDWSSVSTAPVWGAFTTRSGTYLRQTMWGGHANTYQDSARIGVLEGLERMAGMRPRGKTTQVVAPLDQLGDLALDPRTCGVYSDDFYRDNPDVRPFAPDRPIRWVWGWSLRDHRPVLVPEVLAYYQTPGRRDRFVQATSSGCAAGSCYEEAVYSGLMETVERDAFLIAWYSATPLPEIDPRSSSNPRTRQMVDRLAMYGYDARFFDTRITFDIPVVTGVAVRRDGGLGALCVGAGAGLDPEEAMAAALDEIATDAAHLHTRTEREEERLRAMAADFSLVADLHDHPLAFGIPEMAAHAGFLLDGSRTPDPLAVVYGSRRPAPPLADDLAEDVQWCADAVAHHGFDMIVVDQTMPEQRDLGLVTVNVLVPGLVPIDFGWSRQRALHMQRVRTAPREAGLVDHDLAPHQVHRVPHPFP